MYELKNKVRAAQSDINIALRNLDKLIEASSLIIVSVFSYLSVTRRVNVPTMSNGSRWLIIGACVVIGLRGATELLRYLANKDAK